MQKGGVGWVVMQVNELQIQEREAQIGELAAEICDKKLAMRDKEAQIRQMDEGAWEQQVEVQKLRVRIDELQANVQEDHLELHQRQALIRELHASMQEQQLRLHEQSGTCKELNDSLHEQQNVIGALETQLEELNGHLQEQQQEVDDRIMPLPVPLNLHQYEDSRKARRRKTGGQSTSPFDGHWLLFEFTKRPAPFLDAFHIQDDDVTLIDGSATRLECCDGQTCLYGGPLSIKNNILLRTGKKGSELRYKRYIPRPASDDSRTDVSSACPHDIANMNDLDDSMQSFAQSERRVDPLLDSCAVTFEEMCCAHADDLTMAQLRSHWNNLAPASAQGPSSSSSSSVPTLPGQLIQEEEEDVVGAAMYGKRS